MEAARLFPEPAAGEPYTILIMEYRAAEHAEPTDTLAFCLGPKTVPCLRGQ
jgi:hypothetical protein